VIRLDLDQDPPLALAEKERVEPQGAEGPKVHVGADLARAEEHLGQGHQEASLAQVVGGPDSAGPDLREQKILEPLLGLEVHLWGVTGLLPVDRTEELAAAKFVGRATKKHDAGAR
jgi:hypothetical protein